MLVENTIFGIKDKVQISVERIKFAYDCSQYRGLGALYVCFSGGKDSTVLAGLCKLAQKQYGVEYELHYNVTGIDPPDLIYFLRDNYNIVYNNNVLDYQNDKPLLYWEMYEKSMWQLIREKHLPPTRTIRYCCAELKERGGEGRLCLTGVRWAESGMRKNNRNAFEANTKNKSEKMLFNDNDEGRLGFETCTLKRKFVCNPIVDWNDEDVWQFIRQQNLPYCKLYDLGWKRVGCIGCPFAKGRELEYYPKFKSLYIAAFDRMLQDMQNAPYSWKNGQDVFDWWVSKGNLDKPIDGQMSIFDLSVFLQGE